MFSINGFFGLDHLYKGVQSIIVSFNFNLGKLDVVVTMVTDIPN